MAPLSICTPVAIYIQFSDLGHLLSDAVCPKLNINIHIHNDKNYSTTKSCMETSVGNASLFVVFFFFFFFPHSILSCFSLCSDKITKRRKGESLNSRNMSFVESIEKLNTFDPILKNQNQIKSNLYSPSQCEVQHFQFCTTFAIG